ncbi:MAG: universal stress protein, partial [Nitrospirae bacterium]|nr:universal stress protein [Nitrospirota bacterium]
EMIENRPVPSEVEGTQICPSTRLEKLLLSTDGSEFSEGAIREAINLAKTCSSKLFAISVVETNPEYDALAPQLVEKVEKETRQHLETVKSRTSKEGVECEIIVRQGEEPYKYIVEEADKNRVDMIVMGRRGRTGLKRLMMGSETARVIGHSACNVLVVPRAARLEGKNILIATDGSRFSDAAASEAVSIAKRCEAKLIIVSVVSSESAAPLDITFSQMQKDLISQKEFETAENNVKNIKKSAEESGVKAEGLILSGSPYESIVNTAREKGADLGADLIVMGSHGRAGLARLLMGSVTERVIGHAECAVLVVKVKDV